MNNNETPPKGGLTVDKLRLELARLQGYATGTRIMCSALIFPQIIWAGIAYYFHLHQTFFVLPFVLFLGTYAIYKEVKISKERAEVKRKLRELRQTQESRAQ